MSKRLITLLLYFAVFGMFVSCDEEEDPEVMNLAPEISNQSFTISENSANGTLVGTIQAADPEQGTLSFSITAGNTDDVFSINTSSGELTVNNVTVLDFESNSTFTVTIEVSDGENTATAVVTITLIDINENTAPTLDAQEYSIDENSAESTSVGTVVAADAEQDTLVFSITDGNLEEAFAIDSLSGELTVNNTAALDFETTASFSLTIEVNDGQLTSSATITIALNDLIENTAPSIDAQQFSIDENSDESTAVGTVVATDAEQDALTFSIVGGNTDEAFALNQTSGEITVNKTAAIDFETNPTFMLNIAVSDGSLSDSAMVTIQLNDVSPEPLTTKTEITDALNTSYTDLHSYIEYTYLFDAVYTNEVAAPTSAWNDVASKSINSLNNNVSELWFGAKDNIYALNNIINSADEVLPAGQEKDEIIAQALAIRSYLRFQLLNWFGNFPLAFGIKANENATQASQQEILTSIESDLNTATSSLPDTWQNGENYFTKNTALFLLARVKLFNNDWQNVLELANMFVDSGTYPLSSSTDNFTDASTEIIWGFNETDEAPFTNTYTRGTYVPLFRSTEAYLIQAEANVMIGENVNSRTALNALRQRGSETAIGSGVNGSALIQAIIDQWLSEMSFSGVTFSTLKRFQLAEDELSIQSFQLLMPIPQAVIDSNFNLFQNPGY